MELQLVELHFPRPPHCDFGAIKQRAETILAEPLDSPAVSGDQKAFLLFHKQHPVTYQDGQVPAQTALLRAEAPIEISRYADDIQQSWSFRDCEAVLAESRHTLLVTELMARLLEPDVRVRLFHGVLQAAIELTHPTALVFKHTQQVVAPQDYLAAASKAPILRPGSLNVRFYKIENSDGGILMDTRGLEEVGLHDLQCHFRELDPNEVGRVLYNTAVYLFENGPVIKSGNTVDGVGDDSRWICQFEDSLIEPRRQLLDLNPGFPYAEGNRT